MTTFRASSTPYHVFRDGFNIYMMVGIASGVILGVVITLLSKSEAVTILIGGLCILPLIGFLLYYLWANLTRAVEIDDEALRYWEGRRKLVLKWQDIDSVKIDLIYQPRTFIILGIPFQIKSSNKEITFQVHRRVVRIHLFGLNNDEAHQVGEVLAAKLREQQIQFEYLPMQ